jgi:hypothetical protein
VWNVVHVVKYKSEVSFGQISNALIQFTQFLSLLMTLFDGLGYFNLPIIEMEGYLNFDIISKSDNLITEDLHTNVDNIRKVII